MVDNEQRNGSASQGDVQIRRFEGKELPAGRLLIHASRGKLPRNASTLLNVGKVVADINNARRRKC